MFDFSLKSHNLQRTKTKILVKQIAKILFGQNQICVGQNIFLGLTNLLANLKCLAQFVLLAYKIAGPHLLLKKTKI